ncbi:MAG: hypothetical protein QM705_04355 [Ancrocorticia sp.]
MSSSQDIVIATRSGEPNNGLAQIAGLMPNISNLQRNTVTFSEGKALRQAEMIGLGLKAVASDIAKEVRKAVARKKAEAGGEQETGNEPTSILITSKLADAAAISAYHHLRHEASSLSKVLETARKNAETVRHNPPSRSDGSTTARSSGMSLQGGGTPSAAGFALAGEVLTELLSLLETETIVASNTVDIPALNLHTKVINDLLKNAEDCLKLKLQYVGFGVPTENSDLSKRVSKLTTEYGMAVSKLQEIEGSVTQVANEMAECQQSRDHLSRDGNKSQNVKILEDQIDEHQWVQSYLAEVRNQLEAVLFQVKSFIERITTRSEKADMSPLTAAYSAEQFVVTAENSYVLVINGVSAETSQATVTRRLLAPRVHINCSVEADYLLFGNQGIVAAGHPLDSKAYVAILASKGAEWKSIEVLGEAQSEGQIETPETTVGADNKEANGTPAVDLAPASSDVQASGATQPG